MVIISGYIINLDLEPLSDFINYSDQFSLLIHRAVEGWNKKQNKNCGNYFININCENVFTESGRDVLTRGECAMLDCLIDIFEGEKK